MYENEEGRIKKGRIGENSVAVSLRMGEERYFKDYFYNGYSRGNNLGFLFRDIRIIW